MTEVNLKPELRFPEFESEWFEKRLSDLLTFKNGVNAAKENYGDGYKFINVLDIIQNDYITHDRVLGSVKIPGDEFKKNIVEYGDILFQRSSETREEVGQANVYLDKEVPATFGGFVIRGKKKVDYDPSYMNALLKTNRSRKEITSKSGGSTRYNVGQDTLTSVVIYTTELEEQKKIASFLTVVDKRIQLLQKKKAKLEEYKKGVMQKLFPAKEGKAPETRFKDENGNDFPDWEEKKLGEVCEIHRGASPRPISDPKWFDVNSKIGWVRISDVTNSNKELNKTVQYLSELGVKKSRLISKGSLIMSICATIGKPVYTGLDVCIHDGFVVFSDLELDKEFAFYLLQNMEPKWYRYGQPGIQLNLNTSIVKDELISVPSFSEQQKIASFLSSLDKSIESIGKEIEGTSIFKKGLLQKMFV
jgi:type I restriction enzyme S subunit